MRERHDEARDATRSADGGRLRHLACRRRVGIGRGTARISNSFKSFTGTVGTPWTVTTASKSFALKCRRHAAKFEGTAPKAVTNFLVEGSECESAGAECRSENILGRVKAPLTSGVIGYVSKAHHQVGVRIGWAPAAPFQFECFAGTGLKVVRVSGSAIGLVTPTRKLVSALTTKFAQAKGKQQIQHFEGGPVEVLHLSVNGGPSEEAAISFGSVEETSPAVEIKA
jgi:hypothetical protein